MSEENKELRFVYHENTGVTNLEDGTYHAPLLTFNGKKEQDNPTGQTYQIPQKLADILFRELGDKSAQLRLMLVLCGTRPGFVITTKWICERTGLTPQSYNRARQALQERGWIDVYPYDRIVVFYDCIYQSTP